jgi:hypothetical protein
MTNIVFTLAIFAGIKWTFLKGCEALHKADTSGSTASSWESTSYSR